MINKSANSKTLLGLNLFSGSDSFIQDLTEEDEAVISGGRRSRSNNNTGRSRRRRRRRNRSRSRS